MSNIGHWFAVVSFTVTAIAFIGAMLAFFRPRPGSVILRLVLLGSIAAGVVALGIALAERAFIDPVELVIGFVLLGAAHALFWWSVVSHGEFRPSGAFASAAPSSLVMRGAYRLVRHPFYVAYVLAFTAGAVFVDAWWSWMIPVWMTGVYWLAAKHEESMILASPLGKNYRLYCKKVGGFLPRLDQISALAQIIRLVRQRPKS